MAKSMLEKKRDVMDHLNPRLEKIIQQVEKEADKNPRAYRLRVFLFAIFGYAVIVGFLAILLLGLLTTTLFFLDSSYSLAGMGLHGLVGIVALAGIFVFIIRSFWLKIEPPKGYRLHATDAPILFYEIDKLRKTLALPKIDQVLVDSEFNAAMIQNPCLGMLRWHKNTLVLGLPLMLALTPEQARAVIAHEFGHLSGNHSRFSGWVYRVRETWGQVMNLCQNRTFLGRSLLKRFFHWYSPYFNAYTFVLARRNEFEADRVSAQMTSVGSTSMALISTRVCSELIDEQFWKPFFERADIEAKPSVRPFESLNQFCRSDYACGLQGKQKVVQAMRAKTNYSDTHPVLKERLQALGVKTIPGIEKIQESAADRWLGKKLPEVIDDFDEGWLQQNEKHWIDRFNYVKEAKTQLERLKTIEPDSLSPQQRWQLAAWIEEFEPEKDPLPHYESYKSVCEDDPDVDYAIGRIMLERGNLQGLTYLEKVLNHEKMALSACEIAYSFCKKQGKLSLAEKWRERAQHHMNIERLANAERESIQSSDTILSCRLEKKKLVELRSQLLRAKYIDQLWIAEKEVTYFPSRPVYIVVFESSSVFASEKKVIDHLSQLVDWPGLTFVTKRDNHPDGISQRVIQQGVKLI